MTTVDVEVHIPKLGPPDFSLTARQLGQRSGPSGHGGRSSDVWEMVRLVNGKVSLDPQDVAQIGRCNFVKNLFIRVDFGLEYFVASDLRDNINNAANAGETRLADFFHQLLRRVEWHATQHYEQFVKVIMAWEGDIKDDLVKTLPTDRKPTSLSEIEIKKGIGALVADWMVELDFGMKRESVGWENSDYPKIQAQMQSNPHVSVFMPSGFDVPPKPQSPAARRKITFPPCRL